MAVVVGTNNSEFVFGTNSNNELYGLGGNDTLRGFAGNDFMSGGAGFDTVDYSGLGRAVIILPGGVISKNGLGTDRLDFSVERIVGTAGQANTIDGAVGRGFASFNIDLSANRLTVNNLPGVGSVTFTVENFVNARGTVNRDTITGNSRANFIDGFSGDDVLTGSGGNDSLVGGAGIDILNGTSSAFRGNREIDLLRGDAGADGFVLGDRGGSYYRNGGVSDYAIISDFSSNDLIQLGAGDVYQAQRDGAGFDLFVVRNGVRDLVADVRTTSFIRLPSGTFRVASGQVAGNFLGA
ncbi:calcium-binding protein [Leptolyngbya ohadii]|uniref:calcium-binding protein n=1 Tax=Leptolyngbya ohadii TaxID=1962290 RepID=UPI0015C631B9|nr:calcium-binding protein [Leptolyngbya ohadii]